MLDSQFISRVKQTEQAINPKVESDLPKNDYDWEHFESDGVTLTDAGCCKKTNKYCKE